MAPPRKLVVVVDGEPMVEDEARAFWGRFSAWMEEHQGDLAGFARGEGYTSVQPAVSGGAPILLVSRTAAQAPYGHARPIDEPRPQPARGAGARAGRKKRPGR